VSLSDRRVGVVHRVRAAAAAQQAGN